MTATAARAPAEGHARSTATPEELLPADGFQRDVDAEDDPGGGGGASTSVDAAKRGKMKGALESKALRADHDCTIAVGAGTRRSRGLQNIQKAGADDPEGRPAKVQKVTRLQFIAATGDAGNLKDMLQGPRTSAEEDLPSTKSFVVPEWGSERYGEVSKDPFLKQLLSKSICQQATLQNQANISPPKLAAVTEGVEYLQVLTWLNECSACSSTGRLVFKATVGYPALTHQHVQATFQEYENCLQALKEYRGRQDPQSTTPPTRAEKATWGKIAALIHEATSKLELGPAGTAAVEGVAGVLGLDLSLFM